MGCWALLVILCCVTGVYLNYLNKQQEKKRAERGEIVQRQDTSIMTTAEEAVSEPLSCRGKKLMIRRTRSSWTSRLRESTSTLTRTRRTR